MKSSNSAIVFWCLPLKKNNELVNWNSIVFGKNAYSHLILSYSHYFLGIKKCLIRTIFHCLIALFFIPIRTIFSANE